MFSGLNSSASDLDSVFNISTVGPLENLYGVELGLPSIVLLTVGSVGILGGAWMGSPRLLQATSREYARLGIRRSIAALVPGFIIAQTTILFGIPVSFNNIILSGIIGSGLAGGSAGVSREKIVTTPGLLGADPRWLGRHRIRALSGGRPGSGPVGSADDSHRHGRLRNDRGGDCPPQARVEMAGSSVSSHDDVVYVAVLNIADDSLSWLALLDDHLDLAARFTGRLLALASSAVVHSRVVSRRWSSRSRTPLSLIWLLRGVVTLKTAVRQSNTSSA